MTTEPGMGQIGDRPQSSLADRYRSGEHLGTNPNRHAHESPRKARYVLQLLARHGLTPRTVLDVGCGVGEVLRLVQAGLGAGCEGWGYDISPQAISQAQTRANNRLHFAVGDVIAEETPHCDLLLVLDVLEHVEDYLAFLKGIQRKGEYKIFHIPLDMSVLRVLFEGKLIEGRARYGHLHYFSKETALQTLRDLGYEVLDHRYVDVEVTLPTTSVANRLLRWPRQGLFALHEDLAVRLLQGYSLLVLAK